MKDIKISTINHYLYYCFDNCILMSIVLFAASHLWDGKVSAGHYFLVNLGRSATAILMLMILVKFMLDFLRARAVAETEYINGRGNARLGGIRALYRYRHEPSVTEKFCNRVSLMLRQLRVS